MSIDIPSVPSGSAPANAPIPGLYMQVAARFLQRLDSDICRDTRVKPPFVGILFMIDRNPGIRQGLCAEHLGFDATTFGRYVDRLVREGYVLRSVPQEDRRAVSLSLTERGREAVAECHPALNELECEMRRRMGDAEWEKLTELLELFLDAYGHPLPQSFRGEVAAGA